MHSFICAGQSVLGIPFGYSREFVKEKLEARYGKYNVYDNSEGLKVYDISIGNFTFNVGVFEFQYWNGRTYFNYASFEQYYSNVASAKNMRDYLYSVIKDKYSSDYIDEYVNKQGFKCYKFGTDPRDATKILGSISIERGYGKDGIERIYLNLIYGPIHNIDRSSDF